MSSANPDNDPLDQAANTIREALPGAASAHVLVIAGSGLGGFVKSVHTNQSLSYSDIPGIGGSTVAGHAGQLVAASTGSPETPVLIMNGRRHFYEGLSAAGAALLPRAVLFAFPHIKHVIISNAAGGLDPKFSVGDLMLITDQVNWMFRNPLVGRNRGDLGPRFPDASDIYSRKLRSLAEKVALEQGIELRRGVYVAMQGPSYGTRAEIEMLRHTMGAHAVGMSTVPEALIASHMGRQVLGISFISNTLAVPAVTTHDEVVKNAALVEERFSSLIMALLPEIHNTR